jgi:hypothetical protein
VAEVALFLRRVDPHGYLEFGIPGLDGQLARNIAVAGDPRDRELLAARQPE